MDGTNLGIQATEVLQKSLLVIRSWEEQSEVFTRWLQERFLTETTFLGERKGAKTDGDFQ